MVEKESVQPNKVVFIVHLGLIKFRKTTNMHIRPSADFRPFVTLSDSQIRNASDRRFLYGGHIQLKRLSVDKGGLFSLLKNMDDL